MTRAQIAARGALLSSWDIYRKLRQINAIEEAAARSREVDARSPRVETMVTALRIGIAVSSVLTAVYSETARQAASIFVSCVAITLIVAIAAWLFRPRSWVHALDVGLAAYYDPLDVDAYAALQRDSSADGALSLRAVEAWIDAESAALGFPRAKRFIPLQTVTSRYHAASSSGWHVDRPLSAPNASSGYTPMVDLSGSHAHASVDSSTCSVDSAGVHCH